jgi:hypothetical protein
MGRYSQSYLRGFTVDISIETYWSGAIPPEIDKPLHLPALQPAEMAIR